MGAGPPPRGCRGRRDGRCATSGDRYDYDYGADELGEWVEKVRDLANQARRTYLFFNNCHAGQAARSAKLMQQLLRQQGLPGSSRQRLLTGRPAKRPSPRTRMAVSLRDLPGASGTSS